VISVSGVGGWREWSNNPLTLKEAKNLGSGITRLGGDEKPAADI
jgi:hypothetical protein